MKLIRLVLVLLYCIFFNQILVAQNSSNNRNDSLQINSDSQTTQPIFLGGDYQKILAENIKYPGFERENNIEGRVIVQFEVDTSGNIRDIKVIKGVSKYIDQEAMRVVSLLDKWEPGTRNPEQ
ncbi:MAG: energy transducer TonB [Bacteroidia bacterium]